MEEKMRFKINEINLGVRGEREFIMEDLKEEKVEKRYTIMRDFEEMEQLHQYDIKVYGMEAQKKMYRVLFFC